MNIQRGTIMTYTQRRAAVTINQDSALATAAAKLAREFEGTFGVETIDRFLHSSYEQLAESATVANFLPLLAEKFSRQRLRALARVEGKVVDGKPTVLFLCVHNAGRSQMALGFFQRYAGGNGIAWSGGSEPGDRVSSGGRCHERGRHRHLR